MFQYRVNPHQAVSETEFFKALNIPEDQIKETEQNKKVADNNAIFALIFGEYSVKPFKNKCSFISQRWWSSLQ